MKRLSIYLAALCSSGCLVGPNYSRPKVQAPMEYRGVAASSGNNSFADLPWWDVYSDDDLKALIVTALANNNDLKIAAARIEQSREIAAQVRSQFLPAAGYGTSVGGGRNESGGNLIFNGGRQQTSFYSLLSVAWEADLWGRIRRSNEAALANYAASEHSRRSLQLTVAGETAQAYFELLGLDLQLEVARRNTTSFGETLQLFQETLDGGRATRLDTSRAAAALAVTAATIPDLERMIALKENQISVLAGTNPGPIQRSAKLLDHSVPPEIPPGIPSTLLERRPDILAAEQQVKAANAQIGVATAAYFPRIGLTSFLGAASSPLVDITSGRAGAWGFAANAAGPLYQGGALRAAKAQSVAYWEESKASYQQTALTAFREVSDALLARQKFEAIRIEQEKAVSSYAEAVDVARKRYMAGKSTYFEVLEAQQQLFPAENALAITETNRRVVIVQLYKALGGGW